jgi:hypothetical protein
MIRLKIVLNPFRMCWVCTQNVGISNSLKIAVFMKILCIFIIQIPFTAATSKSGKFVCVTLSNVLYVIKRM